MTVEIIEAIGYFVVIPICVAAVLVAAVLVASYWGGK